MNKDKVKQIYKDLLSYKRDRLSFSKGYKVFEEMYSLFKDDLENMGYVRRETKDMVDIVKDDNKEKI